MIVNLHCQGFVVVSFNVRTKMIVIMLLRTKVIVYSL